MFLNSYPNYCNLYIHSQQGWEHFNSFLKVYFFRRTMRGGGKGGCSKIQPLARWLARRMIWMSGISYDEMLESLNLNDYHSEHESLSPEIIDVNVRESMGIHDNDELQIEQVNQIMENDQYLVDSDQSGSTYDDEDAMELCDETLETLSTTIVEVMEI
jgi:hypothetical protein